MTTLQPIRSPITTHLASEAHVALHVVADFGEIWTRIAHIWISSFVLWRRVAVTQLWS